MNNQWETEERRGSGCSGWVYRLIVGTDTRGEILGTYGRNTGDVRRAQFLGDRPSVKSRFVLRMIRWAHPKIWEDAEKLRD